MIRKELKILLYGNNIYNFSEGMLGPLFAVFTQKIGGDILDITWAWALYLIATGTMIIFVGKISDTIISKEKTMVAGYALRAICSFAYLLVSSPIHLFIVQIVIGIATAMNGPTWDALYDRYDDSDDEAGYVWGLAGGEGKLITGIGLIIGGMIVTYGSFKILFITMGVIHTIATIYQARILGIKNRYTKC